MKEQQKKLVGYFLSSVVMKDYSPIHFSTFKSKPDPFAYIFLFTYYGDVKSTNSAAKSSGLSE